ncbi:glycoside hydrolase family 9 protein, partial [Streptomyces sp. NPDC020125]|uniref:glycoside hydrolase family 9 protein n=1 Tax=Streptomyces sp. NPDC020125 TaxID=3154593 RepID=UPI0033D4FFEE
MTTLVARLGPNLTAVAPEKPVPVMVTEVPPAGAPWAGLTLVYIDDIGSYSTNEVAINWNAPLAWLT